MGLARQREQVQIGLIAGLRGDRLLPEVRRRHIVAERGERPFAIPLVDTEEEQLVPNGRAADRTTELVERRPRFVAQELVAGVGVLGFIALEEAAVKLVCAALGGDVDVAAEAVGNLRRDDSLGDVDFLDGLGTDRLDVVGALVHGQRWELGVAFGVDAVDREAKTCRRQTVHRYAGPLGRDACIDRQ